jgi:hypothetical protein
MTMTIMERKPLLRRPDWSTRFRAFINQRARKPFEIGENDCAAFWIAAVEATTGHLVVPVTWRNTQDCLDLLKRADGSLADAFGATRALGEPLAEWTEIRKGDVAIIASAQYGDTFTVGLGDGLLIGPGENHLEFAPASAAVKVWRVG